MEVNEKYQKISEMMWEEYEPYIRKLCEFKLKSLPNYIDDCVQDVFLDYLAEVSKGKVIEYPKAWLLKVANNKIKDIYAHANKESKHIISLENENVESIYLYTIEDHDDVILMAEEELVAYKDKVISSLDNNEQQLLTDRYVIKKSITQIAKEHNTTENNIYQKLFRLKTKTKMIIKKALNQ